MLLYDNGIDNPNLAADEEQSRPVIYALDEKAIDTYSEMREVDRKTGEWVWTLRTPDHVLVYRALPVSRPPGEAIVLGE